VARSNVLLAMNHVAALDPGTMLEQARSFGSAAREARKFVYESWACAATPQRLRVGFVSGDLRAHAVASFFEPILAALAQRRELTLHAYHNRAFEDPVSARLRSQF